MGEPRIIAIDLDEKSIIRRNADIEQERRVAIFDLLEGNTTLFVRADEAEESWRVAAPILDAWEKDLVPLLEYPAGSDGPDEAAFPPRRVGGV